MISCAADLRALEAISVGPSEVVYAFLSVIGEPSALDEALLDDEERARSTRFVLPPDRHRFVLAHAALRLFLARCLDVHPMGVRYESGVHGKPRLGPGLSSLEFNLSHSGGLGLVAVTRDRSVGVDVEQLRDMPDALSIVDTHLSAAERGVFRSLPPAEQRGASFRCWTRKEAAIKAVGEGLGRALDSFDVDLAPGSKSALTRFDGRSGNVAGWSLRDLTAPTGYVAAGAVAVAVRAPPTRVVDRGSVRCETKLVSQDVHGSGGWLHRPAPQPGSSPSIRAAGQATRGRGETYLALFGVRLSSEDLESFGHANRRLVRGGASTGCWPKPRSSSMARTTKKVCSCFAIDGAERMSWRASGRDLRLAGLAR